MRACTAEHFVMRAMRALTTRTEFQSNNVSPGNVHICRSGTESGLNRKKIGVKPPRKVVQQWLTNPSA